MTDHDRDQVIEHAAAELRAAAAHNNLTYTEVAERALT